MRAFVQWAGAIAVGLGLLALTVAAAGLAAPGVVAATPQILTVPPIPHTLDGRGQCLLCQAPGAARPVAASHVGRTESTCTGCHTPAPLGSSPGQTPAASSAVGPATDSTCVACHEGGPTITLANGEKLTAGANTTELAGSVHSQLSCVACHNDKSSGYPHAGVSAQDLRSCTVAAASVCVDCHKQVGPAFDESVHGTALAAGNAKAATCVDCHGAHSATDASRLERRPQICASCHSIVTETYQSSVHGELLASGRADAASCLSCHTANRSGHSLAAVGDVEGPTSAKNVPETCGKCHRQALKTYNSTFHGRAMRLGVAGNAPTCVDCHGAYGVQRVHAAEAPLDDHKVASTCAKCHQGADESFASGWMGHEEPSPGWFPAVFFTERFLFFLTTGVVAFGILHVELDVLRWLVRR